MIKKQILGIYVDRDTLHYVFAMRGIAGFRLCAPSEGVPVKGIKSGNGPQLLKAFLKKLYPDRKTAIFLCLPRSIIYARRIDLPPMPVEDAVDAVKNSLSMHAHLEASGMYYDIHITAAGKSGVKAMLFYAAKGDIDKYKQIFSETGHLEALETIFPLSYGACTLFDLKKQNGDASFVVEQNTIKELVVCCRDRVLLSMTSPLEGEESALLLKSAERQFPQIKGKNFDFSASASTDALPPYRKKCRFLPSFQINHAVAALGPKLAGAQQISLAGGPVSIRIVQPVRYILPIICILILSLFLIWEHSTQKSARDEAALTTLQEEVDKLEARLAPIREQLEKGERTAAFRRNVLGFMESRPDLYGAVNAIAELVPEGTWFSSFTFNKNKIVLRGQGDDALKAVEALRGSPFFINVMLRGSVNRSVKGKERFSVSLDLAEKGAGGLSSGLRRDIQEERNE